MESPAIDAPSMINASFVGSTLKEKSSMKINNVMLVGTNIITIILIRYHYQVCNLFRAITIGLEVKANIRRDGSCDIMYDTGK